MIVDLMPQEKNLIVRMNQLNKITIDLPNGDQLVAEKCMHPGGQIAIGIVHDGRWIQDLAVVETKTEDNNPYVEDKFNVYVYENEYDECYTERFEINRIPSDAL